MVSHATQSSLNGWASVWLLPETSCDQVKFSFRAWEILTRKEKEHRLLVAGGLITNLDLQVRVVSPLATATATATAATTTATTTTATTTTATATATATAAATAAAAAAVSLAAVQNRAFQSSRPFLAKISKLRAACLNS